MKRTFEIDFKELSKNRLPGYGFQALVREIGFHLGYDVEPSGTGPDEGKDLVFVVADKNLYEKTLHRRWLVSCKDNSCQYQKICSADFRRHVQPSSRTLSVSTSCGLHDLTVFQ